MDVITGLDAIAGEVSPRISIKIINRGELHLHLNTTGEDRVLAKLEPLFVTLNAISGAMETMTGTVQHILDNETLENTALGQMATAVKALQDDDLSYRKQLADALAGTTLPPAVQALVDNANTASDANIARVNSILASLAPVPPATGANPGTVPTA